MLAIFVPLGLKTIEIIDYLCAFNVLISFFSSTSHNFIVVSSDPLANIFPLELKARHLIQFSCP